MTSKATDFSLNLTADLHRWRTFLAVAELGSLTRAAIHLESNQSLLSRQINALERDCGARLFVRTGRGVSLSEVGLRIQERVKLLLADAELLESEIRGSAREPAGRVTLGLLPSIGGTLVRALFSAMRGRLPQVQLKILEGSSGQVEEWLADGRIDLAILYRYASALPAHEEPLATVDSYLIGCKGDRITRNAEIAFAKLDKLPFILPSAPNGLRTSLDALARQHGIQLEPVIEADSLPLQKALVAQERLFTVLPLHAVWGEKSDGVLQASRIIDPSLQRTVSMAMAKSKGPARAVGAIAALTREIVGSMAATGMWRAGTTD